MKQTGKLLPLSIATPVVAFLIYALLTCILFEIPDHKSNNINPSTSSKSSESPHGAVPPGLSATIAAREYHISYDRQKCILQSPNRRHNLRAYYRPGHFTIKNRIDSAGRSFRLQLDHEGIAADRRLIYLPDKQADTKTEGNKLTIRHNGFDEEYINNEDGVRQNFIVHRAPAGTRQLQVTLAATGLAAMAGNENELLFYTKNNPARPALIYRDLHCWDAEDKPLTARLTHYDQHIQITVDVENAAYPVTIDPLVANGSPANADALLESDQADALMGFSVASAGDVNLDGYSDVIAGAPHYDHGENDEGAAFLYYGSTNGLNPLPHLIECNQADAAMGYSVSSAGDINGDGASDIAIGAPFYDKGQSDEGAVFVYLGSAKGIKPNPVAILESNQFEAQMGIAVGLAGDIDGNGFSDLVIGANLYDQGQVNEGAAFVFYGSKSGINANQPAILEVNQANAMLGMSVAGAGDINADGYGDVLAGAPFYSQGQTEEGAAFLYFGSPKGLGNKPTVIQSNQAYAHMGSAVASAGDLDADGYADIAVGAPHYDKVQADVGLTTIYSGSAFGINANPSAAIAGVQMNEEMGRSVACVGDVNADGYADLMIGSRLQGKGPANEGVVYIYPGSQAGMGKKPLSTLKSGQANAYLGQSVASAGDVDGDGVSDVVIGCHLYSHGQNNEGAVMIWHGTTSGPVPASALMVNQPESQFGYSVSGAGDIDGDGYDDIVVGAPRYDNGQADEGAAFVFRGTANGIDSNPSNLLEADQADAAFGTSVSAAGDVDGNGYADLIVGAMHYHNGQDEEGAAFVYLGSSAGIQPIPIRLESNVAGAWYGCAVAHAGDLNADGFSEIVIGAMNYSNGQSEEGAIYIYPGTSAGPDATQARIIESDQDDARLGNAVSGAHDVNGDDQPDIVAGAYSLGDLDAGGILIGYGHAGSIDSMSVQWIKCTQDFAQFGWDVSGAGDVNADGFDDVIVGAHGYDNGDGAVFLYYGAPGGITAGNVTNLYSHEAGMAAAMGESVAGAGDLDADGYSDVVIGEPWYWDDKTAVMTGLVILYYGSPTGLHPGPQRITGNQTDAFDFFGWSVAAGGDVDGDGDSDLLIGSPNFSSGQTDADAAFVYYGNNGTGVRNNVRLYNSDLTTLLDHTQKSQVDFGLWLFSRSFLGRSQGKLVWETRPAGQGFSQGGNNCITNSAAFTASQKGFNVLAGAGIELKNKVIKEGSQTRLRARVRYNPVWALTGQMYGPWRYWSGCLSGTGSAPAPENTGRQPLARNLTGTRVYPNPASVNLHVQPGFGREIDKVTMFSTSGRPVRSWKGASQYLDTRGIRAGQYVLRIHYTDATESSHPILLH
ncbi:hypothetical protein GCM10010967_34980 [Dyadobacter beijingensis]|uniref:FG-GAP repeat protein n=1 Tax=Dyadobacter beijingensis TaxID=365489 RepID=A0ABQ2I1Z2_9BACT|nr:FG-GAP-like repeat-containing protein [Dyadobacter beijingensis]GGM98165.1 hypothetical protein GCM10010967_34980 [Dyadobacter beijingensis]